MLPGRSVEGMHVNPFFKVLGTSAGLLALEDALVGLTFRRFLSIPSSIEREDNWR
jgi:hypothetical protein